MIVPPKLNQSDLIGVISPSRLVTESQVEQSLEVFRKWGLKVKLGENIYAQEGYFAGSDQLRQSDLQQMLNDPEIKAIFCSRGGYGMTRLIDKLDFTAYMENPKWLIGFSDITALHLKLNRLEVQSMHGMMPVQFGRAEMNLSLRTLKDFLFDSSLNYQVAPSRHNRIGVAKGQVIGGNLSLLVESLGTSTEIETTGKILFIEEIDEYLYKIDRMLNQLNRAKKLRGIKGLIVGSFSDNKDTAIPFGKSFENIILEYFTDMKIPICFDFPVGHDDHNYAIPCGRTVILSVDQNQVLLND